MKDSARKKELKKALNIVLFCTLIIFLVLSSLLFIWLSFGTTVMYGIFSIFVSISSALFVVWKCWSEVPKESSAQLADATIAGMISHLTILFLSLVVFYAASFMSNLINPFVGMMVFISMYIFFAAYYWKTHKTYYNE